MTARLELHGITKRYPGVVACDDISMAIAPGEIHAVLGENGAGKSTLMKIIYGVVRADSGRMIFDGQPVETHDPAHSRALGIEMVHQHFSLFESVSVLDNISLADSGRFDLAALERRVLDLADRYGMPVDPRRIVHDLSVGERQRVEILRCLLRDPRLLILDEPTSVLTPQAIAKLFDTLRRLAREGCSILYISHKLDEVRELCDTATVLRNGRVTGTADPSVASAAELARLMVGSSLPRINPPEARPGADPLLRVRLAEVPPENPLGTTLRDIALEVHGGEVVGLAGISGNGQAELVALLSGERTLHDKEAVAICGMPAGHLGAGARRSLGFAFVPEERLGRGAVPPHALVENALLTGHTKGMVHRGMVLRRRAMEMVHSIIGRFDVRASGAEAEAHSLSGGNLQKFIVGREIGLQPHVLLVAQPTWGVDVGAAAFIRQTLIDLSRAGTAVLVVSEDLDELLEISDRLLVISQGRLSQPLAGARASREQIGLLMSGQGQAADRAECEADDAVSH